jgi:hypothetical protein
LTAKSLNVMAGLVPAIPIPVHRRTKGIGITGKGPVMTAEDIAKPLLP